VVPAAVTAVVVGALVAARCGDRVDCSWGFEIFLAGGAVLLVGVIVVAPIRVAVVLGRRGAPRAALTGWLCLGLLPVLTVFTLGYGLALTPLIARWLALRRLGRSFRRRAGGAAAGDPLPP
jgi:hypothetical protein